MSGGKINATELVASLICKKASLVEGIQYAQKVVDGSLTLLLMTKDGLYAARDRFGRTPLVIGRKEDAFCVSFENFAYINLGYTDYKELGPGEVAFITPEGVETLVEPGEKMKICSFLWVYYGYPTSSYEGVNVEEMRYKCGSMLAKRDGDSVHPDIVAGVPDSGVAHAIGYANESGIPYARPFIKYTPTWPRSFMPTNQSQRDLIARMKLIPVKALIENKKLLLIDDSIVRGTQLRETTEFLYKSGAKEVHVRPACPPLVYGCKFLNFSRSKSDLDLITQAHHPGKRRGELPGRGAGRVREPGFLPLRGDGRGDPPDPELYDPEVPQAGRPSGVHRPGAVQGLHLLLQRKRVRIRSFMKQVRIRSGKENKLC